jgi:hypothetical protein
MTRPGAASAAASFRRVDHGVVAVPIGELAGEGTSESSTALTILSAFSVAYHVRASAALFDTSKNAAMNVTAA